MFHRSPIRFHPCRTRSQDKIVTNGITTPYGKSLDRISSSYPEYTSDARVIKISSTTHFAKSRFECRLPGSISNPVRMYDILRPRSYFVKKYSRNHPIFITIILFPSRFCIHSHIRQRFNNFTFHRNDLISTAPFSSSPFSNKHRN